MTAETETKPQESLATIKHYIDTVHQDGNALVASGWAVTSEKQPVTISARDENGQELESFVKTVYRPDVTAAGIAAQDQPDVGFQITIPNAAGKKVQLVFTSDATTLSVPAQTDNAGIKFQIKSKVHWIQDLYNTHGLKGTASYLKHYTLNRILQPDPYTKWYSRHTLSEEELEAQRNTSFRYEPKISVVTPLYNTPCPFWTTCSIPCRPRPTATGNCAWLTAATTTPSRTT